MSDDETKHEQEDLTKLTIGELRKIAQGRKLRGYSRRNKADLVRMIHEDDRDQEQEESEYEEPEPEHQEPEPEPKKAAPKSRKVAKNSWNDYCRAYAAEHGVTYKEAMKAASSGWKKLKEGKAKAKEQ